MPPLIGIGANRGKLSPAEIIAEKFGNGKPYYTHIRLYYEMILFLKNIFIAIRLPVRGIVFLDQAGCKGERFSESHAGAWMF